MSSDEETPQRSREKFSAERSPDVQSNQIEPQGDDSFFGPILPPRLLTKKKNEKVEEKKIYGPIMPDFLSKKENNDTAETSQELKAKETVMIGPQIPEHLKQSKAQNKETINSDDVDDDDCDFGPSPSLMTTEEVASSYKFVGHQESKKECTGESRSKRENWMLELPEKQAKNLGLCARQFRTRIPTEKESDRSVWTDTPADKERKKNQPKERDHNEELKMKRLGERDKEMEKLARKAAKKLRKEESLLEMHIKKMKKKKKKEIKKQEKKGKTVPERRPFDRDIDLKVHRFDESQRRAILNKSKFLNDRFASGESKFL